MSTVTAVTDLKKALNLASPNDVSSVLRQLALGDMLTVVEESITIASGTVIDLTKDSVAKRGALMVQSVRVVTGTATGPRTVGDSSCTPTTSLVKLSADGTQLTFEAAITVAVVRWIRLPLTALTTAFPMT